MSIEFCSAYLPTLSCVDDNSDIINSAKELIKDRPAISFLLSENVNLVSVSFSGKHWFDIDGNHIASVEVAIGNYQLYKYKIEYRYFTSKIFFVVFN